MADMRIREELERASQEYARHLSSLRHGVTIKAKDHKACVAKGRRHVHVCLESNIMSGGENRVRRRVNFGPIFLH